MNANAALETFSDTVLPLLKGIAWLVVLLLASAFCSVSETAITKTGRGRLLALQETRPFYKPLFQWLMNDVQRALTLCLIVSNIVSVGASTLVTVLVAKFFGVRALV